MKLYFSPGACSLSPHIVINELNLPVTLQRVDTKTKTLADGGDYRAINPKGQVPLLELDDGTRITEGAAIVQFLADREGARELAPQPGTVARARVQEMLNFVASELHKAFVPLFVPTSSDAEKEAARKAVSRHLDHVESLFGDGRDHVTSAAFTLADAYLFVVTNWTGFVGMSLDAWPRLKAYMGRIAARPAVQAALKAEGLA
jgi:glutathione S-transferase